MRQQRAAVFERVLFRGVCQFVDEGLDEEAMPRGFDAAPRTGWDMRRHLGGADNLIVDTVENVGFGIRAVIGRVVIVPEQGESIGAELGAETAGDIRPVV